MTKLTRRDFLAAGASALAAANLATQARGGQDDSGLIVHEWGVVSGAYKANVWGNVRSAGARAMKGLEVKSDLPEFVATWDKSIGDQIEDWRSQPIEKPVVWFYSKKAMDVKFEVAVPKGRPKAWWPWASAFAPEFNGPHRKGTDRALAEAEKIDASSVPQSPGKLVWEKLSLAPGLSEFPKTTGWWSDCRGVDATPFQFPDAPASKYAGLHQGKHPLGKGVPQTEKFLFYDALTPFDPELDIEWSKEKVTVKNNGEALAALFAICVKGGTCSSASAALAKGASVELTLKAGEPALKEALVKAGLYEKEASIVAGIWKDEFFAVDGVRVLAIAPRAVYDALLPATVTPAPKEFVRVLISHVECLPPEKREEAESWIETFSSDSLDARDAAAQKLRALGPLGEHVVRDAAAKATDAETKARLMELLKR
jgi:hypothetical protein